MGRFLRSFVIVHLVFFTSISFANYPGVTPGSFTVSDSGAASYTLPITTPAGVNGMSPNLAVIYNSSGSNGLMGVGFQLSGFTSGISRCGGSHATDGRASGIMYTNSDKLCLDGQRLVLVSGTPFTNNAEYRTEVDSFSRIMYKDGTFRVYSRDGELSLYGWQVFYGGVTRRWLKSSVQDRSNNVVRYYYQHIGQDYWIPNEVQWAGNRKTVITYKARPDKRIAYEYGLKYTENNLIDKISTYIGSSLIKQYRFSYAQSPVSGLSRLVKVKQCGSAGHCLPEQTFSWNNTSRGFSSNLAFRLPVKVYDYKDIKKDDSCGNNQCNDGYSVEVKRGDFVDLNNDGFVDFVESYRREDSATPTLNFYQNDKNKFTHIINPKPPVTVRDYYINKNKSDAKGEMLETSTYADVNGDGYVDIVTAYRNGSNSQVTEVRINNQNFTFKLPSQTQFVPPTHMWRYDDNDVGKGKQLREAYLIDVNGDGLLDWVRSLYFPRVGERRETYLNTGATWLRNTAYDFPQGAVIDDYRNNHKLKGAPVKRTELIDLNGDGLVDLIQGLKSPDRSDYKSEVHRKVWLNTGNGWKSNTDYILPSSESISDYTRLDQYTRLYGREIRGPDQLLRRGDFTDLNGDGLVDWVSSYRDPNVPGDVKATWLNTGKGWAANSAYALPGEVMRNYDKNREGDPGGPESGSFFDINRDGLIDWVVAHKNRNYKTVKRTYLNTGTGWTGNNNNYLFPDILMDNVTNEGNVPARFGGIMDINGDGAIDYVMSSLKFNGQEAVETYLGNSKPADMITKITDAMGAETRITYKSMLDNTVYRFYDSLSPKPSYYNRKVIGPMPLVSDTSQSNGAGGNHKLKYFYYNALSDGRRGYSGFYQRSVWDPQSELLSSKRFYQSFPSTGMVREELTYSAKGVTIGGNSFNEVLSYQLNFLKDVSDFASQGSVKNIGRKVHGSGKSSYSPVIERTVKHEYEQGKQHIRSVWTNTAYDGYSNPYHVITATLSSNRSYETIDWPNTFWKQTITQFRNDTNRWLIGIPTKVTVQHHAPGQPDQIRTTEMRYNSIGQPTQVIIEPVKPQYTVTTTHQYDGFGNQTHTTVSGAGITSRNSTLAYDSQGLHVVSKTNAQGHTVTIEPDSKCDAPKRTTDANGLKTRIVYDQFCREAETVYPDGTWTRTTYPIINAPVKRIVQQSKNQPDVITYYDQLGRAISTETKGFDGSTITTEKRYNFKGQISRESLPYYNGDTKYWTKYEYDVIGRLKRTIGPDNSTTTMAYQGLTTVITNPKGQTQTQTNDVLGRTVSVLDANGKALVYKYDALGNLLSTRDPKGNQVKMGYDHAGRKISMDDPDMGRWRYEYDVLGQLIKQTDAKGQVITTTYDKLGRMTVRKTAEGTSTWAYDTAKNGVGKLSVTMAANGYKRQHQYDYLSRPSWTYETVNNVQTKSRNTYNSNGKLNSIYYPGRANAIAYSYNALGYLTKVTDYDANGGSPIRKTLWELDEMDAKGNVLRDHYGNGVNVRRIYHPSRNYLRNIDSFLGSTPIQRLEYAMDSIGNLTSRRNRMTGAKETFSYDNLNRLRRNTYKPGVSSAGSDEIYSYQYDELGNITFRSDVGSMRYGEGGYGPHALTSVYQIQHHTTVPETVYNPRGSYKYDANGNLTGNGPRKVYWTSFNKPKRMDTTVDGTLRQITYRYGTDFQRIYKYDQRKKKATRYYGGGSVERISEGSKTHWKYYIPIGAATLEIKYRQSGSNSSPTLTQVEKQYLFKDHLGSTDVMVDDAGKVVERLSFNPWGERRESDWSEASSEVSSRTTRGFTGHEMDDEIGLVNMNARIYDPVIGRFLSPDALIPNPGDLQSYNRYSYVNNNPLSFTDPTGHAPVPGTGRYSYENGNFYQSKQVRYCPTSSCGRGDWAWKNVKTKVSNPGVKKHLKIRVGVYSEIVQNYGGVSRGNAKETRNNYNRLAAGELATNGKTQRYQDYLDKGYAAHTIYRQLKDNARFRYAKTATSIIVEAAFIFVGVPAVYSGTTTTVMNGGDLGDVLKGVAINAVTAGAFSAVSLNPSSIISIDTVRAVAGHAAVGCASSKLAGGSCSKGAASAAGSKLITIGFPGGPSAGKFAATVGVGGLVNGSDGAVNAGLGYLYNYAGGDAVNAPTATAAECAESVGCRAGSMVGWGANIGAVGFACITNPAGCLSALQTMGDAAAVLQDIQNPRGPTLEDRNSYRYEVRIKGKKFKIGTKYGDD